MTMIERFRNVDDINKPPFFQEYLSSLKVLDAECLRADPMWRFAPIAVVGNKERSILNPERAMEVNGGE